MVLFAENNEAMTVKWSG